MLSSKVLISSTSIICLTSKIENVIIRNVSKPSKKVGIKILGIDLLGIKKRVRGEAHEVIN